MIQNKTYYLPFKSNLISGIAYIVPPILLFFLFKGSPDQSFYLYYYSPLCVPLAILGVYRLFIPTALIRLEKDKICYSVRLKVDVIKINWQFLREFVLGFELNYVILLKDLKSFSKTEEVFVFKSHELLAPYLPDHESKMKDNIVYSGGRTLQDKTTLSFRFYRLPYEERQKLFTDIEKLINTYHEQT